MQSFILAQDSKDVLYGLPPLPLTAEEQATSTKGTRGVTPALATFYFQRFFTLPYFSTPPLPLELPYIDTYGINPVAELPPQPEEKYKGLFDDDGNLISTNEENKEKNTGRTKQEEEELERIIKERISQLVKNQVHAAKTVIEPPVVKRDLSQETTISKTTDSDDDLLVPSTITPSPITPKLEATTISAETDNKKPVKNYNSAKEVLVLINEEDGKEKGAAVFDETSLKESLKLSEDRVKEEKPISASAPKDEDTSAVIIGKRVAGQHGFRALSGGPTRILEGLPTLGTNPESRSVAQQPRQPAFSKRRLRIHKNRQASQLSLLNAQKKAKELLAVQFDQQRTTIENLPPKARAVVIGKNAKRQGQRQGVIRTSSRSPRLRQTTPRPQPNGVQIRFTQAPQVRTTHIELPPLNLPKFGQKLATGIQQGQQVQGQRAQRWRTSTTASTRQKVNVPGKTRKPSENFRDIPPVPSEDIAIAQKNFVRIAPAVPTSAPVRQQQIQNQQQPQQFQQLQQFRQQQQFVPSTQFPPRPVVTTFPPPPRYHQIQLQADYREPVVQEYLKELEDYDWHLHYSEQNINNFRGPIRSGGVQQTQIQNGQQQNPTVNSDYDDFQIIERRNHFLDNPPQLHIDLPTTEPTPTYDLYTTQEAIVPFHNNVPTPPSTFVDQQGFGNQQGAQFGNQQGQYGPRPANNNAGPVGVTPHPYLNYLHNLLGFRGPHPLGHLFG
uniref:Uncharacterized protein n=1 Tax=Acrobeloides nanus TaxID=290746 RepID=A0A914DXB9_9BILA